MTPMMTPAQQPMVTPMAGHVATPGLRTPHMTTPMPGGLATPQYQPTPRTNWPSHPGTTPRNQPGGTTPRNQPGGSTPGRRTPSYAASMSSNRSNITSTSSDWAKMAQQWAKKRQPDAGRSPRRRTPRVEESPMYMGTPGTPTGDATPLFDEH